MPKIISSPFSLVRFDDPVENNCSADTGYTLPVYGKHEVAFHFKVDGDLAIEKKIKLCAARNGIEMVDPFTKTIYAAPLNYKYKITGVDPHGGLFTLHSIKIAGEEIVYDLEINYQQFVQILLDDWDIEVFDTIYFVLPCFCEVQLSILDLELLTLPIFWNKGYIDTTSEFTAEFIPGLCFQYALCDDETDDVLGYSNVFNVVSDDCFTSLLTYRCEEDAFEFIYRSTANDNKVRVPLYLSRPQFPKKKESYIKSDGKHKVLSVFVEKEYLLQTDHMPELFHECITIALSHDYLVISNSNIREKNVEVIESDNYNPKWNDEYEILTAQASTKIKCASFGYINSNCEAQEPYCCPPIMHIVEAGNTYISLSFKYGPIEKLIIRYRAEGADEWTEIIIDPVSAYIISGLTPATTYEISVGSSMNGVTCFAPTVTQLTTNSGVCAAVGINGDPVLPNAQVGVAYSYSFQLTGDSPFAIDDYTKPAWMTINLAGNTVTFSGTPMNGDEDIDVDVSITFSNCDGAHTIDFDDTIDVNPAAGTGGEWFSYSEDVESICGEAANLLYSAAPFAAGVTMYLEPALINPLTGFNFIMPVDTGSIRNINSGTGVVGALTGDSC